MSLKEWYSLESLTHLKFLVSIEILLLTFFTVFNNKYSVDMGLKISKIFDISKDTKEISFEILLLAKKIKS